MRKLYYALGKGAKIAALVYILFEVLDFIRTKLEAIDPTLKNGIPEVKVDEAAANPI